MIMTVNGATTTLQQRKPIQQEVKQAVEAEKKRPEGEIPDESDSDEDDDQINYEDNGINDVEFILSKSQVKGDRNIHAARTEMDPKTREYMERVDHLISTYEKPNNEIAYKILTPSIILFIGLLLLAPFVLTRSFYISIPWLLFVGGMRVRLFIIFHDCGHLTFFESYKENVRIGKILEVLVATPFTLWLKRHNRHHRVQGNSDKLDLSSTIPITVNEYHNLPTWKRVIFRIIREPLIFFIIAPLLIWDLYYLILNGTKKLLVSRVILYAWCSCIMYVQHQESDIKRALLYGLAWEQALTFVPGLIGLTLFHLQHSANSGYRANESEFSAKHTALRGSTYLSVPSYLRWITLNIQFHHIHHWSTRVPSYRLEDCHIAGEQLDLWNGITRIDTFSRFCAAIPNALWCDERQRYVTFREL